MGKYSLLYPGLAKPRHTKEERKRILKMCVKKLQSIEDPESLLCRSVLINNTLKRLQAVRRRDGRAALVRRHRQKQEEEGAAAVEAVEMAVCGAVEGERGGRLEDTADDMTTEGRAGGVEVTEEERRRLYGEVIVDEKTAGDGDEDDLSVVVMGGGTTASSRRPDGFVTAAEEAEAEAEEEEEEDNILRDILLPCPLTDNSAAAETVDEFACFPSSPSSYPSSSTAASSSSFPSSSPQDWLSDWTARQQQWVTPPPPQTEEAAAAAGCDIVVGSTIDYDALKSLQVDDEAVVPTAAGVPQCSDDSGSDHGSSGDDRTSCGDEDDFEVMPAAAAAAATGEMDSGGGSLMLSGSCSSQSGYIMSDMQTTVMLNNLIASLES